MNNTAFGSVEIRPHESDHRAGMPDAIAGALGVASLPIKHLTPTDDLLSSEDSELTQYGSTWTKHESIQIPKHLFGTLRITFDLKSEDVSRTAYGQIRCNGAIVGAQQDTTSTSYVTKTEDIDGWVAGATIELWLNSSVVNSYAYAENFRIYGVENTVTASW